MRFVYDDASELIGLNRLKTSKDANNYVTTFGYDAQDRLTSVQDRRSLTTTYTYGALNRVLTATVTDGTVTYEYDNTTTGGPYAKGRLTKVIDPSGSTTYAYDALGRITSKSQVVNATANKTFTVSYAYANGRQTSVTYPSGHAITYGFNSQGQVKSIAVDGTTLLSSATYFPFGPPSGWTWSNGEAVQRGFDQNGRISTLTLGPSTATYPDLSQVFGYDAVNRLITANLAAGQSQSFGYDGNGNRANATIDGASSTYTYPSTSHRLSGVSGAISRSFVYDDAGNTTSSAGVSYVYDGRGRMKQAGAATYLVNGLGQRVKKTAGSDVFFSYDEAGHLMGEYDASGVPIEETVWLGDLPVAVIKPKAAGFDLFYIWADHLGSPRLISDVANVSRWEWANSDPFGSNVPNENPAGAGTFTYNLRFPGQNYDQETGLNYNYFRDYDPSIGRYVESDPIGLRGGLNTYGYVLANPLGAIDPSGRRGGPGIPGWGGTAVPKDDGCSKKCKLRWPDFINFQLDYYVGSAWGTFSRAGNSFVGGGVNRVYPNPLGAGGSMSIGWLNKCDPTPDEVNDFLSGYAGAGVALYGGVGGGLMYSPGNGSATTVGVGAAGNMGPSPTGSGGPGVGYSSNQGRTGISW